MMKLYYSPNLNPRVAVATARYLAAPLEFVRASPRDPNREDSYRPLNPNTLVPILQEEDGTMLWETDAIVLRLSMLMRSDFWRRDAAEVDLVRWISWGTHHFTRYAERAYFERVVVPTFADWPPNEEAIAEDMVEFRRYAGIFDGWLKGRKWLVEDRLSYADFRVATSLAFAEKAQLPIDEFPEIRRWYDQLLDVDAWRDPLAGLET
jgi:glutathione S-transferase